ncbi:MAG: flagellar hook-associated protein FlgL, partial [Synergistaceae bacterium]|nr:flagellar hook-associated protein FlgL [Synergistaceae bacterium]
MSYRVTNSMMQTLMLNDMHANLNKLIDIQQQLSTQRKYQHASQNPHAVTKGMGLETMMAEANQYIKNLQDAVSWLKFTDDALAGMNDLFNRIRELAVKGGDGSLESVDRAAIGAELRQLKSALMSIANSTIAGEYLFAGLMTNTMPFTIGADGRVVYNGNNYALNWEFARQQTGKVSLTGREVFPLEETTHKLKGIEVPLDFEWTGRNEILEFKVGWRTVKVRIPERWTDEIANGLTDPGDYNRFRDPGEPLEGWSLDEIANLINNSTEMGDASKLIKATVVKDLDKGVQYLQIQSLTGEPVRLTSWPETDPIKAAQGIKGAAYGDVGRTASSDGRVEIRFGDNMLYAVDVKKGESLEDIARRINSLPDARIWAAYKSDGAS